MSYSIMSEYEGGGRRLDVIEFLTIVRAIGADSVRLFKALVRRGAKEPVCPALA